MACARAFDSSYMQYKKARQGQEFSRTRASYVLVYTCRSSYDFLNYLSLVVGKGVGGGIG